MTRRQALAFRVTRHHLAQRLAPERLQDAAVVGLQDSPPGAATLALAARADIAPEALDRVSEAVHDSLRDGPLPRDDLHEALRERLPPELLWWCRRCQSHHVHPALWRATGIRGVLAIVGREGRTAVFGLTPQAPSLRDPGAELARRFLRSYGPARPKLLADWAGLATSHAKALWGRVGELVPVDLDGTRAWARAEDEQALVSETEIQGMRLLPNRDPLNAARDREVLVPDPDVRARVWTAFGGPGTVLMNGELAGLWRPARKGTKLIVTVEPIGKLTAAAKKELAVEAERIAPFRGAAAGDVQIARRAAT